MHIDTINTEYDEYINLSKVLKLPLDLAVYPDINLECKGTF